MNQGWQELNVCPLCGASKYKPLYTAKDRHYGIQGWYKIVQCESCSLVFLNPMPDDSVLASLYPKTYYSYQNYFQPVTLLKRIVRKALFIPRTKDPKFTTPGRILDLGCGAGQYLYDIREKGWDVYGVEISRDAAEIGKQYASLNIFSGTLLETGYPDDFFDYIRSNHSFEHIYNPNETLAELHRILKPNGKFLIGVPNFHSTNAKLFGLYWWYLGAPVHTYNYSAQTLSQMLEKHNLVVERVTYNSDYSGVLGSIQIYLNRNTDKISVDGWVFRNYIFRAFAQLIAKTNDLLKAGDAIEIIGYKK